VEISTRPAGFPACPAQDYILFLKNTGCHELIFRLGQPGVPAFLPIPLHLLIFIDMARLLLNFFQARSRNDSRLFFKENFKQCNCSFMPVGTTGIKNG
jgi:hypothetical protein